MTAPPKRKLTLYVAGPMRRQPEFNFPAFFAAREKLIAAGYDVLCPATGDVEDQGFRWLGRDGFEDLAEIGFDLDLAHQRDTRWIEQSDAVVVLDGWSRSEGAQREVTLAFNLGKQVTTVEEAIECASEHGRWDGQICGFRESFLRAWDGAS